MKITLFEYAVGVIIVMTVLTVLTIQGNIPILKHDEPIIDENDLYCFTVWRVQLNTDVDNKTLETILRNEIAEFGPVYDIPQREIKIDNIGNNRVKITIEGSWWVDLNNPDSKEPDLRESISNLEVVEKTENFIGGPVEGGCY
jgi:hypothetical protein